MHWLVVKWSTKNSRFKSHPLLLKVNTISNLFQLVQLSWFGWWIKSVWWSKYLTNSHISYSNYYCLYTIEARNHACTSYIPQRGFFLCLYRKMEFLTTPTSSIIVTMVSECNGFQSLTFCRSGESHVVMYESPSLAISDMMMWILYSMQATIWASSSSRYQLTCCSCTGLYRTHFHYSETLGGWNLSVCCAGRETTALWWGYSSATYCSRPQSDK